MKSWRIVFYGLLVTGLFTIVRLYRMAIHNFRIREEYELSYSHNPQNPSNNYNDKQPIVRRSSERSTAPAVVVAPWTRPGKQVHDAHNKEKVQVRSFVFAEPARLGSDYGVQMSYIDKKEHEQIEKEASRRLCERSKKASPNSQPSLRCNKNLEFLKCVTCGEGDGTWYTAVSETGSVFGRVVNGTSLHFPNYNDGPFLYQQLDIAVPIAGQDDKLMRFATKLGHSVKKFRSGIFGAKITIRLLVTRFPFDEPAFGTPELEKFRKKLTKATGLTDIADKVVFVEVKDSPEFSRAKAVNALHRETYHGDASVLACIDVDLSIKSKFLQNALTYPFPNASAYFPIMFSAYDPEAVELVDKVMPRLKRYEYSEHHGHWRKYSFGMYVVAGSDAARLSMDENFVGWGGEDNDFYARVKAKLNIIRLHEPGLTHIWHPKHCDLGGFVEKKWYTACLGSKAHADGSQLGMYLKNLKDNDPETLEEILKEIEGKSEEGKDQVDKNENADGINEAKTGQIQVVEENSAVLVGVISSRANFGTRVKSIVDTWGQPQNIPEGTILRFFVGAPAPDSEFYGKSEEEDKESLAKIAGIKDLSKIVIMNDVVDDEYPPVRKNTAMIEYMNKIVEEINLDVQWVYKVDDDAYVNFDAMLSFVRIRSSKGYHMYGEKGIGRLEDREGLKNGGLVKPYCTGGPGYIMSRQIVEDTAPHFKDCVQEFDTSDYREFLWHSDSAIGLCIYKHTGAGCWDDDDYHKHRIFRHNLKKETVFPRTSALKETIASHPFKSHASMTMQHSRYLELALS
mmetsp:Transcript_18236/g.45313  ORF Transcript_18236/g.45313 Transcript_18236/m.45313 type:complete len:794 (-) Transcript_18236:60-2441(-)